MPVYEYACDACEQRFEEFRSIHDDSLPPCPACSSSNIRKLISASSFHLKGGGWYATDYARRSRGKDSSHAPETSGEVG